jgi:hypothetical protein
MRILKWTGDREFEVFKEQSMRLSILRYVSAVVVASALAFAQEPAQQSSPKTVLLEVLRTSWGAERTETLVYLRVYSDGFAEAHPMLKVDFRNLEPAKKQLPGKELEALKGLLTDPATKQLRSEYAGYWGNKDFGSKYEITISDSSQEQQIALLNFQPFLARKEGKPYPQQVEKLGCSIWKLRTEVSGEPLEKDWLAGCTKLGY